MGVATAYKPQKELLPFVDMRRGQILKPTIAIALAILFLIWTVLFWLYRPIGRLAEYARHITAGERPTYPALGKGQEVNALGRALRDMRETLEGRSYVENYTQTLTHELKSPLAAIRGSAELLDEKCHWRIVATFSPTFAARWTAPSASSIACSTSPLWKEKPNFRSASPSTSKDS